MDKLFKKLSGIFFAALVTASLSGKAKADNEDASLPEPAPTAVVAPAPAPSAPAASAGSSGSSGSSAASESQSKPAENKPAENNPAESKPAENKPAENKPAENKPTETASAPASAPEAGAPAPAAGSSAPSAPAASAPAASEGESKPAPAESSAPAQTESAPAPSAPAETPAAPVNEAPAEAPAVPVETPAEAPAETPAAPAETPTSADTPTEAPVEAPAEAPADSGETAPEAGDEADAGTETPAETPAVSSSGHHKPSGQGGGTAAPRPAPRKTGSGKDDDAEDGEQETEAEADTAADEAEVPAAAEEAEEAPVVDGSAEAAEADTEAPAEADGEAAAADDAAEPEEPEDAADAENTSAESEEDTITLTLDAEAASQTGAQARSSSGETPANVINLVTDSASNVNSKDDILIKTAGVQHINKLRSDGDVYIIGTGILLVDSVDLLQGKSVYLQSVEEIYGENGGTVALFVATGEVDEGGRKIYELINGEGAGPAILDEEYEIDGVTLVVPDGGKLVMQSVYCLEETLGDETVVSYSIDEENLPEGTLGEGAAKQYKSTAPKLTVNSGARLVIESGASMVFNAITGAPDMYMIPTLRVDGELTLNEVLSKCTVTLGKAGMVDGTSAFLNSEITVEGGRSEATDLIVDDCWIRLLDAGANLSSLTVLNDSLIVYTGDSSIGTINVDPGITLNVQTTDMVNQVQTSDEADQEEVTAAFKANDIFGTNTALTVTGGVSGGGSVELQSGTVVIAGGPAGSSSVSIGQDVDGNACLATIYDYTRTTGVTVDSGIPRIEPDEITAGGDKIRAITFSVSNKVWPAILGTNGIVSTIDPLSIESTLSNYSWTGKITLAALQEKYPDMDDYKIMLEVCRGGVYSYLFMDESASEDAGNVERIYFYKEDNENMGVGGGAVSTATNTTYTGSGILGGAGAGSVTGGSVRFALGGTRAPVSNPDTKPDPAPAVTRPAAAQPETDVRIWTEPEAADECYELHIEIDGEAVSRVARPVEVRMKYTLAPEAADLPLYVVFVDASGELRAFAAYYDEETGELVFSSDISGTFAVVVFSFDGKLFSAAFYDALAELSPVKALLD